MKRTLVFLACAILGTAAVAQTTALDFNRSDCKGNQQHLYSMLDSGKVVILEFFMLNCTPCITAAQKIEAMRQDLVFEYPGKIKSFAISYIDDADCQTIQNWVQTAGTLAIPMDSGSYQVAYYGGMGMPTIVILGGTDHKVLGSPYIGFSTSDTTQMAADIRAFLNGAVPTAYRYPTERLKLQQNVIMNDLVITGNVVSGRLSYLIIDAQGRMVRSGIVANDGYSSVIPVPDFPTGNYILLFGDDKFSESANFVVVDR